MICWRKKKGRKMVTSYLWFICIGCLVKFVSVSKVHYKVPLETQQYMFSQQECIKEHETLIWGFKLPIVPTMLCGSIYWFNQNRFIKLFSKPRYFISTVIFRRKKNGWGFTRYFSFIPAMFRLLRSCLGRHHF